MPVSNLNPVRSPSAEVQHQVVRAEGATGDVAKVTGPGVDVTRTGTGVYRLTWAEDPGNILGVTVGLQADVPADLAGYSAVTDIYDADSKVLDVYVFDESFAPEDLAVGEFFTVMADFSYTNLDL